MTNPSLQSFLEHLSESLANGSFVRVVLSDPRRAEDAAPRVVGRWVTLKGTDVLSLTHRYERRDETKNVPLADAAKTLSKLLAEDYKKALLGTTGADWQLIVEGEKEGRLIRHPASQKTAPARSHDHEKATTLDARAHDWMRELHLITPEGKVRASMSDKLRQINRYLEILSHQIEPKNLPADRPLRVADMGCGKAYLTFGVWHWLKRVLNHPVQVIGVEARHDLVQECSRIVTTVQAEGLEFRVGTITQTPLPELDVLIALHACNRATDDAVLKGIETKARWIVLAPCCHQDLRPTLRDAAPFDLLLSHGLLKERFAEWLTDGLRALYLEAAGYDTKTIEFVAPEHTTKNLMILASKRSAATDRGNLVRERINELQQLFGISDHPLARLLE